MLLLNELSQEGVRPLMFLCRSLSHVKKTIQPPNSPNKLPQECKRMCLLCEIQESLIMGGWCLWALEDKESIFPAPPSFVLFEIIFDD